MEVVVLDVVHAYIGISSDRRDRNICFKTHCDVAKSKAIRLKMNIQEGEGVIVSSLFT